MLRGQRVKTSSIFVIGRRSTVLLLLPGEDAGTSYWLVKNTVFFLYVLPELLPLGFNKDTLKVHVPLS